jgi:hypothetical protein
MRGGSGGAVGFRPPVAWRRRREERFSVASPYVLLAFTISSLTAHNDAFLLLDLIAWVHS